MIFRFLILPIPYIRRCIACDICPTHVGPDDEYRCIIKHSRDLFQNHHQSLIDADAIVVAGLSPKDPKGVQSVYQRFIERTRYLRRGDYVLGNIVTAPLIFEEIGSQENLALRTMTSMLRHNTVMYQPITAQLWKGDVINRQDVVAEFSRFLSTAVATTTGRYRTILDFETPNSIYNPVGYVLSVEKDEEDVVMKKRNLAVTTRYEKRKEEALSSLRLIGEEMSEYRAAKS